jgi:hypothetical protein
VPVEPEPERRPGGRYNDGQRVWQSPQPREEAAAARPARAPRPHRAPADPFFDQPYEPSIAPEAKPAWEAADKPVGRALSPNIKPKKKVPALFKATETES